jgi:hypothetical protein
MRKDWDNQKGGLNIRPIRRFAVGVLTFTEKEKSIPLVGWGESFWQLTFRKPNPMRGIEIDFLKIKRSEVGVAIVNERNVTLSFWTVAGVAVSNFPSRSASFKKYEVWSIKYKGWILGKVRRIGSKIRWKRERHYRLFASAYNFKLLVN